MLSGHVLGQPGYKLADGGGLSLEVTPKGALAHEVPPARWYRNRLRFSVYPEVSLIDAPEKRDQARKLIAE